MLLFLKTGYLKASSKPFDSIDFMVTQFPWPGLLSPFYVFCHSGCLLSSTSGCLCLPTQQTLTVTHFLPHQKAGAPWRLRSPINQPVSSFLPVVPVGRFHFGLSAGHNGAEREMFSHQDRPPLTQEILMWWWWHQDGRNGDKYVTGEQRIDVWGQLGPTSDDFRMSSVEASQTLLPSHPTAHPLLIPPLSKVGQRRTPVSGLSLSEWMSWLMHHQDVEPGWPAVLDVFTPHGN